MLDVQFPEIGKPAQVFQPNIGNVCKSEVEFFQARQRLKVFQSVVCDVGIDDFGVPLAEKVGEVRAFRKQPNSASKKQ